MLISIKFGSMYNRQFIIDSKVYRGQRHMNDHFSVVESQCS